MFKSARLKLTAWYLLIIMTISLAFSAVIYRALNIEIERFSRLQKTKFTQELRNGFFGPDVLYRATQMPVIDPAILSETRQRILVVLTTINATILVGAGLLGYYLAGRTLQPIKEMMDQQYRFISDASHELKTPLTAMRTSLEVTLREKSLTGPKSKRVLKDNLAEVVNLQRLSENLLELTNNNSPRFFKPLHLTKVLKSALSEVKPLAKDKNITISVKANESLTIKGDELKLTRALVALLDNAIKYSPTGKSVKVIAKQVATKVAISITDQGAGIKAKDLPHITERFYRADSARSTDGYGLGLSIVQKIVKSHSGKMSVTSKTGHGTTVTLTFPLSA